jgi:diguanylate cyclase (GGDEF)-like protein
MNQPHQTGLLLSSPARPAARTASYSLGSGIGAKPLRRRPVRSLTRAVICLCLSAMVCAASLSWMLTAPSSQGIPPVAHPSLNASHEITSRLLVGGIGICLSVGFGIIGLLYWPGDRNTPVRKQDVSLSTYDSITGLPGRRLYLVLLSQALTRAATTRRAVAVLVATLEEFRPLPTSATVPNVTLVVRVQAARIKSALQPHDAVARLSTHTFAVMVDNLESADKAIPIAEKIQSAMSLPLLVEGQELLLSCRIGVATSPQDGTNAELLLDAASQILSNSQTANGSIVFLSDPTTQSSALPSTASSIAPSTDDHRPTISVNR